VKHIEGSSHHTTTTSWKGYWEAKTGEKCPTLCPGSLRDSDKPHVLGGAGGGVAVGCHVLLRNKAGHKRFAIVPVSPKALTNLKPRNLKILNPES